MSRLPFMPEAEERNEWFTPDDLFREIEHRYGPFDIDAAASEKNAKCDLFYDEQADGLSQPWEGVVWCNPPYKNIIDWVRKAFNECRCGRCKRAVLLLPAQTSTAWFHDYALKYGDLYWVRGKRKFGGAKGSAIMPSLVVVFYSECNK